MRRKRERAGHDRRRHGARGTRRGRGGDAGAATRRPWETRSGVGSAGDSVAGRDRPRVSASAAPAPARSRPQRWLLHMLPSEAPAVARDVAEQMTREQCVPLGAAVLGASASSGKAAAARALLGPISHEGLHLLSCPSPPGDSRSAVSSFSRSFLGKGISLTCGAAFQKTLPT